MRSRVIGLAALAMASAGPPAWGAGDINSPYGVVAFIPSSTRLDAMRDANIAWGRYDFSWRSVEAAGKGAYNWAVQDYAVAEANARGLHIYAGLGYTPTWASSNSLHRPQDRPTNNQDWYDYVYAAVSRYKGSIKYWEMWNEPNLTQFWNGTRAQYIQLFKVGADAAHAADPDCMVLGPEISSAGPASTWMTDLLQQAGNKIDIISFHQYDGNDIPSGRLAGMDAMHNTIVNLGYGNKPIWITESGFRADAAGMTEQKQADYLTQTLTGITARPWIKKFFWYQLWEGATETYGLLRENETRKPVWQAYHDYTTAHPALQTVSVNLSTTDIVEGINLVAGADGHTTPDTKASRACRRNTNAAGGDYYMYFNVDDAFALKGNRRALAIDVDYYDLGSATLTLEYDSIGDGAYKSAGSVVLGNKDTWKQVTFELDDAYFGNRQNNGADFRISAGVGTTFYLDLIQLSAPRLPGDFNSDGAVNATDIDLLCDRINAGAGATSPFDVNADGLVNTADVNFEVTNILHTKFGDTDTDGDVDLADLGNLASGFQVAGERRWSRGNFDCDTDVDLADLGTLATNFQAGRAAALAEFQALVPEPAIGVMLMVLLPGMLRRWR
jgi:hypothetical protein